MLRRLKALMLGGIDMTDVIESASYLLGQHDEAPGHDGSMPWRPRRTLEAGLFVTYARPFTKSHGLQTLQPAPGLSPELAQAHGQLVDLRHWVFAHSDDTPFRQLRKPEVLDEPSAWPEDIASWVRAGDTALDDVFEQWTLPTRLGLEQISVLAQLHREHFALQIDAIVERLRAAP